MKKVTKDVLEFFCKRLYEMQQADIPVNAKKMAIDRDYRIITDFVSTEEEFVSHATPHLIRNNKWWSVRAVELFRQHADMTFRNRCDLMINGRRAFAVEHEYPVGIVKTMLLEGKFGSVDALVNHCIRYGRMVVVTQEENDELNRVQKTAGSIKEAHDRYANQGIIVRRFSAQLEKHGLND